ncbi:hypothetical protein EDD17DRAFT_1576081 [Pisolithus thermaeus]|nr:hypothetical protein EDD17DRAFT_1576081 [Pisolithus thermaeus]
MFLDDKIHTVSRSKFWTSEERGFVTCTLGKWESSIKITDDLDSEDDSEASEGEGQGDAKGVTSGPPPPTEFDDLSVNAQLAYVKPVLRAVLGKGYAPAIAKHNAFMKGGPARAALLKDAGVRGGLDVRFIKAVQRAICKWVLGDSKRTVDLDGDSENERIEGVGDSNPPSDSRVTEEASLASTSGGGSREGASEKTVTCMVADEVRQTSNAPPNEASVAPEGEVTQCDVCALESGALSNAEPKPIPGQIVEATSAQPSSSEQSRQSQAGCDDFESLSGVEKLDYCLNILLPEAIKQLLLWKSGERTSAALLSDEEEQRLHDRAMKKASETDWVDDVIRLREAQARQWGIDLDKAPQEPEKKIVPGGTRTRPRRATVSK